MSKQFGYFHVPSMTRRILKLHDQATPEQMQEGTTWYQDARKFAADIADRSNYTLEQVAGVIAVLSPQCSWKHNMIGTLNLIADHDSGNVSGQLDQYPGYTANVIKAHKILDGDLTVVSGPKVTAFYKGILGDLSFVTVDVWATRAARSERDNLARVFRDDETPGAVEHRAIAEAYRRAAAARGIEPAACQAVVWVHLRQSNVWVKPQNMPGNGNKRFYAKQMRARKALGLTIHTGETYWGGATNGMAAAKAAA